MRLLCTIPELEPFLTRLRPYFSRAQFRHLARYMVGLIGSKRKTIRNITASTIDRFNQSSMNRFINSRAWSTDTITQASWKTISADHSKCPGGVVFLIMDDTLLEKFGEAMDSVGYQHNPKDGKSVLAHDLVSCIMVCPCGEVVPIDLKHYVKESVCKEEGRTFKTRIELAKEMIESFNPPHQQLTEKTVIVLFDSWYLCKEIVKAIKLRGWHFVSETKSNRNVRIDGTWIKVRDIEPFLREEQVVEIKGKRYAFRCMGKDNKPLFMPSLGENGDVNLIMEKELNGKDHTHYIVTDMMDITPTQFISFFKERHTTEEFYRDAKQNLGLGKYMVRNHEATNRHWWIVFLTYNALNHLKRSITSLARKTVGELCEWVQERCEEIKWSLAGPRSNLLAMNT